MSKAQVTITFDFGESIPDADSFTKDYRNGYVGAQRDRVEEQIESGSIDVDSLLAAGWTVKTE